MGKNHGIIYKITNKINDKIYVGKTKKFYGKNNSKKMGINGRLKRHIRDAINNKNYCPLLCKAIRKYGKENFEIEQLTQCKLELTCDLEMAFISFYKSREKKKDIIFLREVVQVNVPFQKKLGKKYLKN